MKVEGVNELIADLTTAGRLAGLRASLVVKQTAEAIADTQRQMVPRQSGRMANAIEATAPDGRRLGLGDLEAEIGPGGNYGKLAPLLEFGTSKTPPKPFVFPAADLHAVAFETRLQQVAGDI